MQNDRWKEITRIFHAALDLPPEDRHGFVSAASRDPEIQSEVEKLLLADEKADSYLESPLIPPGSLIAALTDQPQLRPGDILCQRFHILRAVGSGGMGQVFEAHDSELAVNVALKLIRPEVAANPQALARFRQEVRLARRITHPNVCRTFDLDRDTLTAPDGQQRTLVFLTMEFLDGETLAARLKRTGRLTLDEILVISRQIAAALDAAHALGIIHRDIKPGNIMLVPAGENSRQPARVVITDFGLARLDPVFSQDENSITQHSSHSAHPIGTLAYMAPEQMDGSPISATTDIYAFGLILFEMATGQRAFPSSNLLSGIAQRLSGPPPSPTSLQPGLPQSFEQAIQGCLRLKPEDRFQSAQAVMDCLECRTGQSQPLSAFDNSAGKPQPRPRRWTNWTSRNTLLSVAAILLLAVSLFLLGLRFQWWEGNARLDPGALVYLAPVTNQTGEKSLDNITELLQASLEQSAHINLLDQGRVGDTLQRMIKAPEAAIDPATAREVAMRTGAVRVIFATVTGSGGSYQLNIDIQQPDNTPMRYREHWPKSFPWKTFGSTASSYTIPQGLLTAVRDTSDWIRFKVGESKNDIARLDAPPEDVTTKSWEALLDFEMATELNGKSKNPEAVLYLQRAVKADPDFALAYGRLGDLQVAYGASVDGLRSYARALDLSELQHLTLRERDRIRGLAATDSGDFDDAISAFRDYTVSYEHDHLGWFYLGFPLVMAGRIDEGLADLRKSYQMAPSRLSPAAHLGMFDAATGNYREASDLADHLMKDGDLGYAHYILGLSSFLEGNYDNARAHFTEVRDGASPPGRTGGTMLLAHLDAERGQFAEAIGLLTDGILSDRKEGDLPDEAAELLDRAAVHCRLGAYSMMLDDIREALNLDRSPARINAASLILGKSSEAAPPSIAGRIRSLLYKLDREYAGDDLGNYSKLAKLRLHSQALLELGQWEKALIECRKANALDTPISDRSYWASVLVAAASHVTDPKRRDNLLEEALRAYTVTVLHPGLAWKQPYINPAGFLAEEMTEYLSLAAKLGKHNKDVTTVRDELLKLQPRAIVSPLR